MWTACKQFVCSRIKFVLKMHFKCIATKMLPGFHEYHAKRFFDFCSFVLLSKKRNRYFDCAQYDNIANEVSKTK